VRYNREVLNLRQSACILKISVLSPPGPRARRLRSPWIDRAGAVCWGAALLWEEAGGVLCGAGRPFGLVDRLGWLDYNGSVGQQQADGEDRGVPPFAVDRQTAWRRVKEGELLSPSAVVFWAQTTEKV